MTVMELRGMWWWPDRWIGSKSYLDMTLEEQGGYRNLLDQCWLRGGGLPDSVLAKACGDAKAWPRIQKRVMRQFHRGDDGLWHNTTLDTVMAEAARRIKNRAAWRDRYEQKKGNGRAG